MSKIIETDRFPFENISKIAEKESWRKDVNRPIYHLHKWWAKRLGSVFRAIILGCTLPEDADLLKEFYQSHSFNEISVLDPFMGSGTTIGEALKLGVTSYGKDINPVAAETVRVSLTPIDFIKAKLEFENLTKKIGEYILSNYKTVDSKGNIADILYYFWVMQGVCVNCKNSVDLFSNYILAKDAYPQKKPGIKVICPCCGNIFGEHYKNEETSCPVCATKFKFREGPAKNKDFICPHCDMKNKMTNGTKPTYRLYAKLILTNEQKKEYLKTTEKDIHKYEDCKRILQAMLNNQEIRLPDLPLEDGYNTQQAINYGFKNWKDFFNDRQLLLLGLLYKEIGQIADENLRSLFSMLFSSTLEFNNLFASYKGEGTGAVRHMFSHHILKPERTPIEPNIWGTSKSSGSFAGIFKNKIKRVIEYRNNPKEVALEGIHKAEYKIVNKEVKLWETDKIKLNGSINLACGDSSSLNLVDESVDFVITDPPFFDNVHYSELADFFYSWLKLNAHGFIRDKNSTTRHPKEVQDSDNDLFSDKLENVFRECHRVLKNSGLLIFSYHHSKNEGWTSIAKAIHNAGFIVKNAHPVKAEMSVATPKQQAKEPIQLDIILVCKKRNATKQLGRLSVGEVLELARMQALRLETQGFKLSKNDLKVILYGQLLKTSNENIAEKDLNDLLQKYFQASFVNH